MQSRLRLRSQMDTDKTLTWLHGAARRHTETSISDAETQSNKVAYEAIMSALHLAAAAQDYRDVGIVVCHHIYVRANIDKITNALLAHGMSTIRTTIRQCNPWEVALLGISCECRDAMREGIDRCEVVVIVNTWTHQCLLMCEHKSE